MDPDLAKRMDRYGWDTLPLIYGGFRSMILLFCLDSSLQPAKVRAA